MQAKSELKNPRPATDADEAVATERKRIESRRDALGVRPVATHADSTWGLALSGGGIRSATFSLGVLQALARAAPAETSASAQASSAAPNPPLAGPCILSQFDYLSTVSGGGYIGSFFCSLFVPGRLAGTKRREPTRNAREHTEEDARASIDAAVSAYGALTYEPPGRIRSSDSYDDKANPGKGPMAWLRENGRYLTPTGAGDLLYAMALAIRNLCAVHYVLGTILLMALALIASGRSLTALWCPFWFGVEEWLLERALPDAGPDSAFFWWSALWVLPALVAALLLVPVAIAFWLTHPKPGGTEQDPPRVLNDAPIATAILSVMIGLVSWLGWTDLPGDQWRLPAGALGVVAAMTAFGFVAFLRTRRNAKTIGEHRVVLTRRLAGVLEWVVVLGDLGLVDSLGQTLYLRAHGDWSKTLTPAATLGAVLWLVRHLAQLFDEKQKPSWLSRLPLDALAGVAGGLLFLLVAMFWALLAQWVQWAGLTPNADLIAGSTQLKVLGGMLVVATMLAFTAGQFPGFINLSTLQALYGARLTRAYLGASNGERFKRGTEGDRVRSVAEPSASDQLSHQQYYAPDVLAPLHIINVTLNQTTDRAEQLVQRDRKGKPLAILPHGFSIDGKYYKFRGEHTPSEVGATLSMGQWIGTSGAAFTTGLGRATSLGTSILLGLANVRLGTWWCSGCGRDDSAGFERLFGKLFKTQQFLYSEFLAQFHGLRREWQYLSDGGHFENTAIYELLRPQRKLSLIVVCDAGCDRPYQFEDLANVIRLARIDFAIEIEVDTAVAGDATLGRIFGVPADMAEVPGKNDKCALLLNVFDTRPTRDVEPRCRIILIKPRLIRSLPVDVRQYADTHATFPQETTADQFFDEAQWESYRKLGHTIGSKVFTEDVGSALWRYLGREAGRAE